MLTACEAIVLYIVFPDAFDKIKNTLCLPHCDCVWKKRNVIVSDKRTLVEPVDRTSSKYQILHAHLFNTW